MDNKCKQTKTIEEMIASGELGTMTECAYGSAVADKECENTLNKKKEHMTEKESGR